MAIFSLRHAFQSAAFAAALICLASGPVLATPTKQPAPNQLFVQAEQAMTADRPRFLELLARLHRIESRLTPSQMQHLALLDALKADLGGDEAEAIRLYKEILAHDADPLILARARSALTALYLLQRKYVRAYTQANTLISELPRVTDRNVQHVALKTIIRVLTSEKRYQQSAKYAEQLIAETGNDPDGCMGRVFRTQALIYAGHSIASTRKDYLKSIDVCRHVGMLGYTNGLRLDWSGQMVDEGHPDQAIANLHRISPSILKTGFPPHIAGLNVVLSLAYLKKGNDSLARKYALAAVKANDPKDFNWTLEYAYNVLYKIAKHDGRASEALVMYEKYMAQFKAATADDKAQAMAYQMVKQDVLTKKLKLDELSKQNRILQLRQSLDRKSAETSRLNILLLLMVLAFIVLWAYRIKHSQLRFRKMAREDDLTGAFNRQHFFDRCELVLERLKKSEEHACLLILDLDHFKRINDIHGHVTGDAVLEHAANIIRHGQRASDILGRLGGEEFGVLMPGCTREQGAVIGNRIRAILAQSPTVIDGQTNIMVTISVGLASTEICGHALRPLLINADAALYEAKAEGRNQLVVGTGDTTRAGA